MKSINLIHKQRGLTMISTLIILMIIAFVVYVIGFRVAPIYMEYFKNRKIVEGVKTEVDANSSPAEVQRAISRRFDIDYVTAVEAKDLKVSKSRGKLLVTLKYEDSKKLFADLYVVGKFNEIVQLSP
jgi:hypothetical protein